MTGPCKSTDGRPCVLLAEDDEAMRHLLAQTLRKDGCEVVECSNGFRLLDKLGNRLLAPEVLKCEPQDFDLIVSDIRMPGVTGLGVLEGMRLFEDFPPMILITAFGNEETHAEARKLGAAALLDKPFEIEEFLAAVHQVLAPASPSPAHDRGGS